MQTLWWDSASSSPRFATLRQLDASYIHGFLHVRHVGDGVFIELASSYYVGLRSRP